MDIVERLRQWAKFGYGVSASADMNQAADEIERLRTGNRLHLELAEIQNADIERLREENEKLFSAISLFQIEMHNALFALEKTVDDIHRKDSE